MDSGLLAAAVVARDAGRVAALVQDLLAGDADAAALLLTAAASALAAGAGAGGGGAASGSGAAVPATEVAAAPGSWEELLTLNLSLALPRGRFDVVLAREGLRLRSKAAVSGPISWAAVRHVLRLPKPEGSFRKPGSPARAYYVVLALGSALQMGKQAYNCIVVNADSSKPLPNAASLSVSTVAEDGIAGRLRAAAGTTVAASKARDGDGAVGEPEHVSLVRLFLACSGGTAAEEPDTAVCKYDCFKAYRGVDEGVLYPLRVGLCFLVRPALFIPAEDIARVSAGRDGEVHCAATQTDLTVKRFSKDAPEEVFSNISRSDIPFLVAYAANLAAIMREGLGEAAGPGPGGGAAEAEEEDDEEADGDYEPEDTLADEPAPVSRRRTRASSVGAPSDSNGGAKVVATKVAGSPGKRVATGGGGGTGESARKRTRSTTQADGATLIELDEAMLPEDEESLHDPEEDVDEDEAEA